MDRRDRGSRHSRCSVRSQATDASTARPAVRSRPDEKYRSIEVRCISNFFFDECAACCVAPTDGMRYLRSRLIHHFLNFAAAPITRERYLFWSTRGDGPLKLRKRFAHDRHALRAVSEQMRAKPIDARRVIAGKQQSERQWLRRERAIALPRDDRVDQMHHTTLRCRRHAAIELAIKQNPVEIETGAPDRVVTDPGAFDAELVAGQVQHAIELRRDDAPCFFSAG